MNSIFEKWTENTHPVITFIGILFSIGLSIFAAYFAYQSSIATIAMEKDANMPILVFTADKDGKWSVTNFGKGPALNILICEQLPNSDCSDYTKCNALAPNGSVSLHWIGNKIKKINAWYIDIKKRNYKSQANNSESSFEENPTDRPKPPPNPSHCNYR